MAAAPPRPAARAPVRRAAAARSLPALTESFFSSALICRVSCSIWLVSAPIWVSSTSMRGLRSACGACAGAGSFLRQRRAGLGAEKRFQGADRHLEVLHLLLQPTDTPAQRIDALRLHGRRRLRLRDVLVLRQARQRGETEQKPCRQSQSRARSAAPWGSRSSHQRPCSSGSRGQRRSLTERQTRRTITHLPGFLGPNCGLGPG